MIMLRRIAVTIGAASLAFLGLGVSRGEATVSSSTCSGGTIYSGTYVNLTVTGHCTVAEGADVVVKGTLTVVPGAGFDAATDSTVTVSGNVVAGTGSYFALGCTYAHPCDGGDPPDGGSTNDYVAGNLYLNAAFDAAINGDTIGGSLVSSGGGPGYSLNPWIPFSIKDNQIHGNLTVTNLHTSWFGAIRNTVGGTVTVKNVQGADEDSNEVVTNTIGGNLICSGNSPHIQYGDSGGDPNIVSGVVTGECTAVV